MDGVLTGEEDLPRHAGMELIHAIPSPLLNSLHPSREQPRNASNGW
jgi:hypothetical protein